MAKEQSKDQKNDKKLPIRSNFFWIYIILFLGFIGVYLVSSPPGKEISWRELKEIVVKGDVDRFDYSLVNDKAAIYLSKEALSKEEYKDVVKGIYGQNPGPHYSISYVSGEAFKKDIDKFCEQAGLELIEVRTNKNVNFLDRWMSFLLPIAIIVIVWIFISRRLSRNAGGMGGGGAGGMFNFGKVNIPEQGQKSDVTFDQVAGLDEAKEEIQEVVEFLRTPEQYTRLGAKIPKGVILAGPPGTGKTLMAKAVAGEANAPFYSLSGSDFVEMFVGVGASRVRDLFKKAKEKAPAIVFIDEIDAIGRSRGGNKSFGPANDERENTLNQLLAEMDGFESNSGVIVIAATNRAEILDSALMRPGRFDRHIYLELPNQKERQAIYKVHTKKLVLGENVDLEQLSNMTPGFSGADIANVCNEAALMAARQKSKSIEMEHFHLAVDRVVAGLEKKSTVLSDDEKKKIAYHEAGHVVSSWFLPLVDPISKVSIIPRGKSLGAAWYLPNERKLNSEENITQEICAALGGRAAEEIVFGEVSTGALSDLEKATKQAYSMVAYYGFSEKLKNVTYYDSSGNSAYQKPFSEDTAEMIDQEVRSIIDKAYNRTLEILNTHREQLNELAEKLMETETVYSDGLNQLLGQKNIGNSK